MFTWPINITGDSREWSEKNELIFGESDETSPNQMVWLKIVLNEELRYENKDKTPEKKGLPLYLRA